VWNEPQVDEARRRLIGLLPELRGYARFLARDATAADDLVQDAVVRALAALPQLSQDTALRPWLFTILRNTFFEQARRRRSERTALSQQVAGDDSERPGQHGSLDLADLQRQLFTLPPLLREALVLVGAQGVSYEEAAVICGVPVGTVKARVSRARAQLAERIDVTPVQDLSV
jgi:RNA polymerase sigma-70 factor (ECF subfamily)